MNLEVIDLFKDYLLLEKRYSSNTVEAYINDVLDFFVYVEKEHFEIEDMNDVGSEQIRRWIVHLNSSFVSNRSINRKLSSLRSFYKFLQKAGWISINPVLNISSLKFSPNVLIPFSEEEVRDVYSKTNDNSMSYLIIDILYSTGVRVSELINIKLNDIDLHSKTIKIKGKGGKYRYIAIMDDICKKINFYVDNIRRKSISQYLFFSKNGLPLQRKFIYNIVKNHMNLVTSKVKKSPHVFRHTFATHLLNRGASINAIKELMGHSSLSSTEKYINNDISTLKNVYKKSHPRSLEYDKVFEKNKK